jgi:hypothetical protein
VQRFDHERVLADPLGDRRQFAGLDERRQLRRFLQRLREPGGVGHDLGPLQLADQRALARALRQRLSLSRVPSDVAVPRSGA